MSSIYTLEIGGKPFGVSVVRGREAVGEPFSFEVFARPEGNNAIAIGGEATLAWPLEDGSMRTVTAMVDAFEERGGAGQDTFRQRGATVLNLVPKLSALADAAGHRVFVEQDALEITESILREYHIRLERRCERSLSKRAQRVQSFESDLAFVTRILAKEGILWFLHPQAANRVVAVDHPSGFTPIVEERLRVRSPYGFVTARSVWDISMARRAVSDKVTLRDFDLHAPSRCKPRPGKLCRSATNTEVVTLRLP